MLTAQTQYRLAHAQTYFAEHLAVGDYYAEGQSIAGQWFGMGAQQLGLSGAVTEEPFLRLCENQHPQQDVTLTQRLNTVRREGDSTAANRRIFFDFTFSPPKSVLLIALLSGDPEIRQLHAHATAVALEELEHLAAVRVRKGGQRDHRPSRNIVAALFTHETSRTLDPHLHTHAIVFNASWDPMECRWKALENQEILQGRRYLEAVYNQDLARSLHKLGYQIIPRPRGDFEVAGVPEELCRRFSKRHAQIDAALAQLLVEKPELGSANLQDLRSRLATVERARKQKHFQPAELQEVWSRQLTVEERSRLLAAEFVRLAGQGASSVVVSQTWSEVHRLNTEIRAALKAKGLLGTEETVVEALERVDLTSAQKRDRQFYPDNAVVLFNRPVRSAPRGATCKLAGILSDGVRSKWAGAW